MTEMVATLLQSCPPPEHVALTLWLEVVCALAGIANAPAVRKPKTHAVILIILLPPFLSFRRQTKVYVPTIVFFSIYRGQAPFGRMLLY